MRLGVLILCLLSGVARADEARMIGAGASSESGAGHAVDRLFDLDEATTWCAKEKARVSVAVKLDELTELDALHLALGDYSDWRGGPRVKQVIVRVMSGSELVKKIRHKWPDSSEPREGRVNLDAPGDGVIVEIDLVYAGTGTGGVCVSGMRLDGVDTAPIAAKAWGAANVEKGLVGSYTVDGATLELKKRGKLAWSGGELRVEGKWSVVDGDLQLTASKVRRGKGKLPDASLTVPLRFGPRSEGDAPVFTPWFALTVVDGALAATAPTNVTSP